MPAEKHPHVAKARQYVADVIAGRIVACSWIKLACERSARDLKASRRQEFPFYFDADQAERACKFVSLFPHTKGRWAAQREPFVLEPWEAYFVTEIFGWRRRSTKMRRFRKAALFVPRKNGKSEKAARIGLYMFAADDEHGAEVYSGATSEKQAWEVFRPALLMAKATPDFISRYGVETFKQSIAIPANASRFEPVIGKPGDGASPSCAIVDEYHEHDTNDLIDTMKTGMGAREQPLLLVITTAGSNTAGPCYALWTDAQHMLEGTIEDDEMFALLYTIDAGDDWTDPAMLQKANPNYGVSVGAEFLQSQLRSALGNAREQGTYQTKHLNVWVGARNAYFDMPKWLACRRPLVLADFTGRSVKLGLDLASTVDINALNLLFRDGDRYSTFSRFYLPETTVALGHNQHYQAWEREGHLIVTEGEIVDMARICADIIELATQFRVEEIAYDPFQATMLVAELTKAGLTCVEVRPTVLNFSGPMKMLDGLIRAGLIEHDGSPVMNWMVSNVTAPEDAKDNVYPRKERRENKIDGVIALLSALARHQAAVPEEPSIYEVLAAERRPVPTTIPSPAAIPARPLPADASIFERIAAERTPETAADQAWRRAWRDDPDD
jgi:phage terminase large subunit-like protein